MTATHTATPAPTPCPAFSAGGDYCPWCGDHVGEYGYLRQHTAKAAK